MALGGSGEIARLWATVGADVSEFLNRMNEVEQRATSTGKVIEGAFQAIGVGVGLYGLRQVVSTTVELERMGAQAERLGNAFGTLAGTDADRMLDRMREAARGTVSDMDLMAAANKAMMLNVTRDAEQMGRLLEVAAARGHAMGLSTAQAFSDIVTGIGRMSPMILDNLGILTGGQAGFEAYARSIGKAADQLTDMEKRQYLLNKVLNDTTTAALAAGDALDKASQFERVGAQKENLQVAAGQALNRGLFGDIAGWAGNVLGGISNWARNMAEGRQQIDEFYASLQRLQQAGYITAEQWRQMQAELGTLNLRVDWLGLSSQQTAEEIKRIKAMDPAVAAAFEEAARDEAAFAEETQRLIGHLGRLKDQAVDTAAAIEDTVARWGYQFATADSLTRLTMLQDRLAETTKGSKEYYDTLTRLHEEQENISKAEWQYQYEISNTAARLQMLQERVAKAPFGSQEYYEALTEQRRLMEDMSRESSRLAEQQQEQWAQKLRSTVESVLSPTSVTASDIWRTQTGTYTGKWDEYIRRLRSAIEDPMSAWKHLLPADVLAGGQAAMQGWFEEQSAAFYAGQLPEMIDWAAFDRQVQDAIAKQQAREALIQEAMKRSDGALGRAQVSAMLGLPATTADVVLGDFAQGVQQTPMAAPLVKAFEEQLAAEQENITQIGKQFGGWLAAGMEQSMTPAVGRRIARALFPYFAELLPEERP